MDQKGCIFQNRFFYDYLAPNNKIQIYTELNTELNFSPKKDSFANDSFRVTPGVFFSYFPFTKSTLLVSVQHSNLIALSNAFSQNFTSLGGGVKYQLTKVFNLEMLYTNFIRGERTGLGETFNLGLRVLIN